MLKQGVWFALLVTFSCVQDEVLTVPSAPKEISLETSFYYEINLNDRSDDTFKVRLFVDNLQDNNNIFQFPATVPGTYNISDFGRFVKSFKAYNNRYEEIATTNIGTNQWAITDPRNTRIIEYTISETFDTPVTENPIYPMAGTSIENDHVLLNTFGAIGFLKGLRDRNFYLKLYYPKNWTIGTSLQLTQAGYFYAKNYDYLVDSPLLLGQLTSASKTISTTNVSVFAYSKTNQINAPQILADINQVLVDAEKFLKVLPVDHYTFLYHFENTSGGALEHAYSSVYVLPEQTYSTNYGQYLKYFAAHEFFHIVTPLNIHSEIIQNFNFTDPTPSEHLWLYEGVTEWAAHMMQYRNSSISEETILATLRGKIAAAKAYSPDYSLTDISLKSYTYAGQQQYRNVYLKGAIVATLLDIHLLELSQGTYGLRELLLDLIKTYGKENAFSEVNFFNVIKDGTYPEIGDFLMLYIRGKEALPLREYFAKIGVIFEENPNGVVSLTKSLNISPQQQYLFERWSENF